MNKLEKSSKVFEQLVGVSQLVDDMAGELQPAIDQLATVKRTKTTLTDNLRDAVLEETPAVVVGDYFDGRVSTFLEQEIEFPSELASLHQVIKYAETYKEITGVDILASLIGLKVGNVKERIQAAPQEFGLVKQENDGLTEWVSKGITIKAVKKVRVARKL